MVGTVCCPKCGSYNVSETKESCLQYQCMVCKTAFGNISTSHYSSIVKEIKLDINGFFTDRVSFTAQNAKNGKLFKVQRNNEAIDFKGTIDEASWLNLSQHLFDNCFLEWWKPIYYSADIVNGTSWTLEVRLYRKHVLIFRGINGFPPYWNTFLSGFEAFFNQAGITLEEFYIR